MSLFNDETSLFIREAVAVMAAKQAETERAEREAGLDHAWRISLEHSLAESIGELVHTPNTRKFYLNDFKRFRKFCKVADVRALPAMSSLVALFLQDAFEKGASLGTIYRLKAAISDAHNTCELFDPTNDVLVRAVVRQVMKHETKEKK